MTVIPRNKYSVRQGQNRCRYHLDRRDLDHGELDLAVRREEVEVLEADGHVGVRGAVDPQPAKGGLGLGAANTESLYLQRDRPALLAP